MIPDILLNSRLSVLLFCVVIIAVVLCRTASALKA